MSVRLRPLLVLTGGRSRRTPEHGAESADTFVTEIESHVGHWGAAAQAAHRFQYAGLLSPGAECQAGFGHEQAGESAGACVGGRCPLFERTWVARRGEQTDMA